MLVKLVINVEKRSIRDVNNLLDFCFIGFNVKVEEKVNFEPHLIVIVNLQFTAIETLQQFADNVYKNIEECNIVLVPTEQK